MARAEIVEKYQPGSMTRLPVCCKPPTCGRATISAAGYITTWTLLWRTYGKPIGARSDSAPENTIVDELKRDLEEVASFKGSRAEQLLMVFCKQTKLRYNKLTEEEKQWLTRIVQKSELAKSYVSQRGKRK